MSMTDMIPGDFRTGDYKVWRRSSKGYAAGVYTPYDDVELDVTDVLDGVFTSTGHAMVTGQGPIYLTGDIPLGLEDYELVWIIRIDDDSFSVAASRADALAETAIDASFDPSEPGTLHLENSFVQSMSITPITGRITNDEESGNETEEDRKAFSEVELYGRAPGFDPDQVEIDGEFWEVGVVKRWEGMGELFFECDITRLDIP